MGRKINHRQLRRDRNLRVGSTKAFADEEACLKEVEKLIAEKMKTGYIEETEENPFDYETILPGQEEESSPDFVKDALEDKGKISILVRDVMPFGIKATKEWLEFVLKFLDKWGICNETLGMLARFSLFPGAKKHLNILCERYNISALLQKDNELNKELFYEIQSVMDDYYDAEDYSGHPTKAWVKKVVTRLSVPLIAFGYGLHPVGLKTMLRCFDNGAVERIDVDWYINDVAYDSEDFPYYDGIENEEDEFWKSINITELI